MTTTTKIILYTNTTIHNMALHYFIKSSNGGKEITNVNFSSLFVEIFVESYILKYRNQAWLQKLDDFKMFRFIRS